MSRVSVFPTENEKWTLKMSIGSRISQLSKKDHPARTLSIQPPITKNHSTQVSSNETFRNKIEKHILGIIYIDLFFVVVVPYN